MARTSAADLARGLKGTQFPTDKEGLIEQARENGAPREIIETIEEMPDTEFGSLADVEHQFSLVSKQEKDQGTSSKSTESARRGGHTRGTTR